MPFASLITIYICKYIYRSKIFESLLEITAADEGGEEAAEGLLTWLPHRGYYFFFFFLYIKE